VTCLKHNEEIKLLEKNRNSVECFKCKEESNLLFSDYSDLTSEMVFEDLEKLIQNFESDGQISSET
jgi:hypothetical protein